MQPSHKHNPQNWTRSWALFLALPPVRERCNSPPPLRAEASRKQLLQEYLVTALAEASRRRARRAEDMSGVTSAEGDLVRESVELPAVNYVRFRRATFVGYVFGESTTGQAALYHLGLADIQVMSANNNCSTGSAALVHAATLVRAGDVARMAHGALGTNPVFPDRLSPMCPLLVAAEHASPDSKRGPPMPRVFGAAATEYFRKYIRKNLPR
ncbi:hypothetical protein EI94DRAFT_1833543 [Lactarius quietus]|nr:hypothetical protein EI94DRAFT_1833543 [Lactarius quietus]